MEDIYGKIIIRHEFRKFTLRVEALPEYHYESKANPYAKEGFPKGISCTLPIEAARVL